MPNSWVRIFKPQDFEVEYVRGNTVASGYINASLYFLGIHYKSVWVKQEDVEFLADLEEINITIDGNCIDEHRWN